VRGVLPEQARLWIRRGLLDSERGLLLALLAPAANLGLLVLSVVSMALTVVGVGLFAFPATTAAVRRLAGLHRRLAGEWAGMPVGMPYRPRNAAGMGPWQRYRWTLTDPATWRDLLWLVLEIPVALVLGLIPAGIILYGLEGLILLPVLGWLLGNELGYGLVLPINSANEAWLVLPQAIVILMIGLALAPQALRWHAVVTRSLLAPTRSHALAQRVQQLTETRSDTVDAQAAELRRIERDLHDGAQARLVALSMNIGLAEEMMATDPELAQQLLAEARESSGQALVELRNLVRGIHPPVLAERGLGGAVQALALAAPLPVDVDVDLPGRPEAPVESAVYFAVAEALTNAGKHSRARRAWIRLSHRGGTLRMVVGDDGVGGADPDGTGLRGIQRRLAAFDGTMSVSSPPGGPTVVIMELPCESSSPKTSPSSGTG